MANNKVTIKDVAREAGVSISTVSNAINGVDVLLPETREHVLEVARRLHYVPNLNGKNPKSRETKVLGLFVTSIRGPYYSSLADEVYQSCKSSGYELQIFVGESPETILTNVFGKRVDGAIVLNNNVGTDELKLLEQYEFPTVFIDREIDSKIAGCVVFDSYHEGELAAKHLIDLGHTNLMLVAGEKNNFDSIEREKGFVDVIKKAGLTLKKEYIVEGLFSQETSYYNMKEFLKKGIPLPDAIFACNDMSAIGVIDALKDAGYSVPGDVSIVGCDDIDMAKLTRPPLTTIRTSYEKQGKMAVEMLISMIREGEQGTKVILNGKLMERESTAHKLRR